MVVKGMRRIQAGQPTGHLDHQDLWTRAWAAHEGMEHLVKDFDLLKTHEFDPKIKLNANWKKSDWFR